MNAIKRLLKEQPIRIPGNPFWDVFKRFSRDEMIAMVLNIIGTIVVTWILGGLSLGLKLNNLLLAIAGPVIEKFGFFIGHFKDALELYRTTSPAKRKKRSEYFKRAVKGGSVSLLEDILCHDPIYIVLMYFGIKFYPTTPPWLIATTSFVIALFVVAIGEVMVNEIRYLNRQRRLKKIGFEKEKYYESRFFISSEASPDEVLKSISNRFDLKLKEKGEYKDRYYETKLPGYSGREVKFRLRDRSVDNKKVNTAQIIYKRVAEISKSEVSQFRFFPQEKHKYYLIRHQNNNIIESLKKNISVQDSSEKCVKFKRTIARKYPDGLFVSIDDVQTDRPFFLVELKVYKNLNLLKEAMRFVMTEFPVTQTTYSKEEMINA